MFAAQYLVVGPYSIFLPENFELHCTCFLHHHLSLNSVMNNGYTQYLSIYL
jgi:hypothetical protein